MKKQKPRIKFRQTLFWDTNPKRIDEKKHARYIIERILQFGQMNEAKWLFHRYQKRTIKKVLGLPRVQVSPKSKGLWSLMLK